MNFIQQTSRYDHEGKARHYQRNYEYRDEQGAIQWSCDVFGNCISAPTVFTAQAPGRIGFKMTAKGKFMNASYFLDDDGGHRFATITRKGVGFHWKVLDAGEREIFRVVDPASWKEAMVRDMLGGLPDGFAVIQNDRFIARISSELLVEAAKTESKNLLGRLLDKVLSTSALTLRIENDRQPAVDTRMLVATMTLLKALNIAAAAQE